MDFRFDHVVHFTNNPESAIDKMNDLGFHALLGGQHQDWGTYNGLCHFDLSYIEYIGVEDINKAESVLDNFLIKQIVAEKNSGEGLSRIALRTNNIEQAGEWFHKKGLSVKGPVKGSRKRADGSLLEWSMLFIEDPESDPYHLPFIIDWKQTDEERRNSLINQHIIDRHLAGDARLSHVGIAVKDIEKSVSKWKEWFNLKNHQIIFNEQLNAKYCRLHLKGTNLVLCSPTGDGILADTLKNRGERPFLIKISGANIEKQIELSGGLYILD
ncbi:VOC family protein [Scopulibacillus cellulosilyticus]|uniref:VOC family protein n=1 Tax=Scopulibacillus cellulosilyticus TaxID=2665665 RepID=A0ABW2PUK6_9BACL